MTSHRASGIFAFACFLVMVGLGWLLTTLGVVASVDWLWVACLAAAALLPVLAWGVDRATLYIALMFGAMTVLSILRQISRVPLNTEVPLLVIASGAFLLAVRVLPLREPEWMRETRERRNRIN